MVLIRCLTYMEPNITNYELAFHMLSVLSIEADMQEKQVEQAVNSMCHHE